jgi:cell wall-associated NlpC family hydrolase
MADKVAAIEASRGSEFQDALKAAQDARRGDYSTLASLLNTQFNQKLAVAKLNQSQTQWLAKFKQDASQFGVRTALQQAGLQLGYAKLAQSTLNADRSYALALEGMGYKKQKAQLDALALETKLQNGGLTATTVNKLKGDANYIATTAFNGENEQGKKGKKLPIGQAMAWMRRGYTDKYGRTSGGVPPSIALEALRKAGYTVPRSWEQANLNSLTLGGQSPFQGAATSPANAVAQTAKAFLGVPYVWGGTSVTKGLDCSAFAQALLARLGVKIPRTTYTQFKAGTPVALAQLQPGDLVFTRPGSAGPNHVGVYIGNGQIQQSPHTGDVNKITPLSDFLTGGFVGARRYR